MTRATLRAHFGATAACFITVVGTFLAGLAVLLAPAASAATSPTHPTGTTHQSRGELREARLMKRHDDLVAKVIREARKQKGKPYVYGDAGPGGFDCSGLVRYVFEHSVHRTLPHNAAQQYDSLHHIKRSKLRVGDLIFTDEGYISHVGIYAGHDHWWVAPHTGTRVQLQRIYSAHFVYARVLLIHPRH